MINDYENVVSLCPVCCQDSPARYEFRDEGVFLAGQCHEHGPFETLVERNHNSFRWGYEQDYEKPFNHFSFPVTYRCNLSCKYCYTMSNSGMTLPPDRPFKSLINILEGYKGNVTFIGGEPTMRDDLFDLIEAAGRMPNIPKVSVATNGQNLNDREYVGKLKDAGVDFVYLSFNAMEYDRVSSVTSNKLAALRNLYEMRIPVWLQGTIDSIGQLDSFLATLEKYRKIVFSVTLRAVKPLGIRTPKEDIFVSDILGGLGLAGESSRGTTPFNRFVRIHGTQVKICSWVFDMGRIDPIDSDYIISDDTITTFHRGTRVDELLLRRYTSSQPMHLYGNPVV